MSLKVDLKSKEMRRGVSFDYGWIFVVIALVVFFIIFWVAGMNLKRTVAERQAELQSWQTKVAGFQGIEGQLQTLQGDITAITTQINKLRDLRYDPLRYSILLVRISQLLPSNIWFGSLSVDPSRNQFTVTGTALDEPDHPPLASIADLIMNLQNDKNNYFSDVVLQSTTSNQKEGNFWTFNLQANYNIPLIGSNGSETSPAPSSEQSGAPGSSSNGSTASPAAKATSPNSPKQGNAAPSASKASPKPEVKAKGGKP